MIIIVIYFLLSLAIVHFGVYFLDRGKASPAKSAGVCVLFAAALNIIPRFLPELPVVVGLGIYFAIASMLVWAIFRVKVHHAITIGALFIALRIVLVNLIYLIPGAVIE